MQLLIAVPKLVVTFGFALRRSASIVFLERCMSSTVNAEQWYNVMPW